jgi:hypothetical protein
MKKLLKKYVSLGDQAEKLDTYQAYKEKIDIIKNLDYEGLYNIMRDTEDALTVCLRGDSKAKQSGIFELTKAIIKLGTAYLEANNREIELPEGKLYLDYTYEYIEKEEAKKAQTSPVKS